MPPLEELKQLDAQIENAAEVATLKPVYERLEQIALQNRGDFEIQLAVEDVRRHVFDKGIALKRWHALHFDAPAVTATPAPPPLAPAPEPVPVRAPVNPEVPAAGAARASGPIRIRRAVWIGAGLGITAWLILFVVLVQIARNRNMPPAPKPAEKPAAGTVPVDIATNPPGAKIRINGEEKCQSDCRVNLTPGNYQVTALLDGFDPGATGVTVVRGAPINVHLDLVSQTQTLRLYTDLEGGRVLLDGQPAGELQDGQLVLDRVPNGKHTVRIVGKMAEASFAFEGESGKRPVVAGPIAANNILAIVVSSLGNEARVQSSSSTPLKVVLNDQAMGDTGTLGLDLKYVPPGDQTLVIGEGQEQRKLVVSFGPTPAVTAFLKADVNTGTLVIATGGEDDVSVFLNGKEYRRKTRRGELRIQTVGPVAVRVAKAGFHAEPEQKVEVKKGEETRLAFQLRPLPRVASLQVRNGAPGTQILLGNQSAGRVGADGSLSASNLAPGDYEIEARRDGFLPKKLTRTLKAGETLVLNGVDLAQAAATGTVNVSVNPPDAAVTYRKAEETQSRPVGDRTLRLDPGAYVFTARAPNFVEHSERATVAAGETRNVEITLAREVRAAPPPPPKPAPRAAADWRGWIQQDGNYVRKGGNRVVVQSGQLPGTITFTAHLRKAGGLFRPEKLRWFVDDDAGYRQFEVDKKKFSAKGPGGSRSRDFGRRGRDEDEDKDKVFTVQVEITSDRIIHRVRDGSSWVTVDSQPTRGTGDGKFGFVIPGNDEIAISDFRFVPK